VAEAVTLQEGEKPKTSFSSADGTPELIDGVSKRLAGITRLGSS